MGRGKFAHIAINRVGAGDVVQRQKVADRRFIQLPRHLRVAAQGVEFAGENQRIAGHEVEQRLFPHSVPGQQHPAGPGIVDGESEHSVEHADAFTAQLFIQMNDYLGVGVGFEFVSALLQLLPEFAVVVDFTVQNHDYAAVLVGDRLRPMRRVDDRQATVPEGDFVVAEKA